MMVDMMKNKEMMKSMMRQQGMGDISDEQLEMMGKMMTPEMLRSMGGMDLNTMAGMRRSMSMPVGNTQAPSSNQAAATQQTGPGQESCSQEAPPPPPNMSPFKKERIFAF